MSLNAQSFVDMMKEAARMTMDESAPFSFAIGKVLTPAIDGTTVDGMQVQVDDHLKLSSKQLILTNAVRDYYVKLTTVGETLGEQDGAEHYTGYTNRSATVAEDYGAFDPHRHEYKGDKRWKVNLALQAGESVLMLRTDGGQKYIVLDRVFAPNNEGIIR